MPVTGIETLETLGLPEILLWLFTFAIVYGILSQVKIPQSNAARTIIASVAGFMVLFSPATYQVISILSKMATDMLLVVIGILVLIVFLEVMKVRVKTTVRGKVEGREVEEEKFISPIEKYGTLLVIILAIFAILIFVSAGGLES
jgi:amino acid permease